MRFTKMQGAGNDYIYLDCFQNRPSRDPVALSRAMSDRHVGVGSDGLILICPSEKADARMRMFNADGSEAEMCGNGLRCVAKYVYDHGLVRKPSLQIETERGVLRVDLELIDGKVRAATIDMGEPILVASRIPTTLSGNPPKESPLEVAGHVFPVTCVSMGNPHCVIFENDLNDTLVLQLGPR